MKKCVIDDSSGKRRTIRVIILTMKLLTILIFAGSMAVSASVYSQRTKIDLQLQNSTVGAILKLIEDNSEFIFIYDTELFNTKIEKSISVNDASIEKVLEELFGSLNIDYLIDDRQVFLYKKDDIKELETLKAVVKIEVEQPQKKQLTGKVTDSNGEPVPGAAVIVKGTTIGVSTNFEGGFTLDVPIDAQVLSVSFVGMKMQEIPVEGKTSFIIILEEETVGIEDVVVVGYGRQKKMTVTGSVSSVSEKELVQSPVSNISNALVGRATGIIAVQRDGAPGEDKSQIRIRGAGSFAGSSDPLILVDGVETENYNQIDPNEISGITILKDASSTAVYGVRGANGVLLITTKRGMVSKPKVSYSSNVAVTTLVGYREKMGAVDYTTSYNEGLKYDSYISGVYNQYFTDDEIELYRNQTDPVFYPDVDWMDLLMKDYSFQQQHNLNIRGGTEAIKYFVSAGMFQQFGQFNNTNVVPEFFDQNPVYKRYNFRSNFDVHVTKRLTIKVGVSSQLEDKRGLHQDNAGNFLREINLASPLSNPGRIDGKFVNIPRTKVNDANPFAGMYTNGHRKSYINNLDGTFRLEYDMSFITQGLLAHVSTSYQNKNDFWVSYNKPLEQYTAVKDADNNTVLISNQADGAYSSSSSSGKFRRSYSEVGLNYSKTFGDHNITGLLLYNQTKSYSPGYQYLIPMGYQGLVGRVAYDYKNKYLVEYNAGYNGTENFAPGKRFGYFPAYSVGYVLSEESFFPKNNIISFVKIRGSHGEVGNDKIGGNRFLYSPSAYTYNNAGNPRQWESYYFGEVGLNYQAYGGSYEGAMGNPDLTWEKAEKSNIGTEITLFKDKLRITADIFREKRDNILLVPKNVPDLSGIGNLFPPLNLGKSENKGWDGDIEYNNKIGALHYWIKGNFTYATNKIIFQDEVLFVTTPWQNRTGQRNGQFFGYSQKGLYNSWEETNEAYRPYYTAQNNLVQPGVIVHKDINGDGVINPDDQVPLGYSNFPEKSFGFSIGFDYKGFDFSALLQGAANVTYMNSGAYVWNAHNWLATSQFLVESWSLERYEQGLPINYPHLSTSNGPSAINRLSGSFFGVDGRYIRLKNAEIGYRIEKLGILQKLGLESARIYINGSNLFTWAPEMDKKFPGIDPEDYSVQFGYSDDSPSFYENYPRVAVYNFGININF